VTRRLTRARTHRLIVVAFAVAMAWVEAACVYYLRVLVDRIDPHQANPLPLRGALGQIELAREAATLLMIAAVGWLAGTSRAARLGYAAIAFGVWDIFYYVFLRAMCGWPRSLLDWDILFLLPLPWWGPAAAPMCIALLMIAWGTLVAVLRAWPPTVGVANALCAAGILLALYVFMADAIRAASSGGQAVQAVLPTTFNWTLFVAALALMAAPIAAMLRQRTVVP